jgi:hypothetical protein
MQRNEIEDQVLRRIHFSKLHPQVNFEFRPETGVWEATFPIGGSGTQTVYASELKDVLNKLEERLG